MFESILSVIITVTMHNGVEERHYVEEHSNPIPIGYECDVSRMSVEEQLISEYVNSILVKEVVTSTITEHCDLLVKKEELLLINE